MSGRTNYGQVCVRSEELNYKFKELVRAPGFLSNATILRKEFIIVRSRSTVFPGDRSRQGRCGALTPSFLAKGTSDELVCGSNPADRYEQGDSNGKDLLFAQDTPLSGQRMMAQGKLRMMAQGAALKDAAAGMLRRLLAYYDESDAALSGKAVNRKRTPRRREPAKISDARDNGVTGKSQSQTCKVARHCV